MKSIDALNKLNSLSFSYFTSAAFSAAQKLEVFDFLSGGGMTSAVLAEKINIHPKGCQALLGALENIELVKQEEGKYYNSELGVYLCKDSDVPMAFPSFAPRMMEFLPDALRENSPRHEQAYGKSSRDLYKEIFEDSERFQALFRMLDSYNIPIGQKAAEMLDFSSYNKILDLAGGSGCFAAEVVKANSHLTGVVLDLAPVRSVAENMIKNNLIEERFEFVAGDMFKPGYPESVDVIFLSYILHNWGDDKCKTILKNCFDSLPSKGMLVVSEKVLNDDNTGEWWGIMMSLQMLVTCEPGAKERSLSEYSALLKSVGFQNLELIKLDAPRDFLLAYKP